MAQIEEEVETKQNELGQISARIELKNEELERVQGMVSEVGRQRQQLMMQSRENMQFDLNDIEQELEAKDRLLNEAKTKYSDLKRVIVEEEKRLDLIQETIQPVSAARNHCFPKVFQRESCGIQVARMAALQILRSGRREQRLGIASLPKDF